MKESDAKIAIACLADSIDAIVSYMPTDENTVGFIGLICNQIKKIVTEAKFYHAQDSVYLFFVRHLQQAKGPRLERKVSEEDSPRASAERQQKMKVSEMTNEELASWLETAPDGDGVILHGAMREAAARLRNVTVRSDNSKVIEELQQRLKIAEDALQDGVFNLDAWVNGGRFAHTESDDDSLSKMRNALAATRGRRKDEL